MAIAAARRHLRGDDLTQSCDVCAVQINRGEASEEDMAVRREKAMADPAIQAILTDPVMRQVPHANPPMQTACDVLHSHFGHRES